MSWVAVVAGGAWCVVVLRSLLEGRRLQLFPELAALNALLLAFASFFIAHELGDDVLPGNMLPAFAAMIPLPVALAWLRVVERITRSTAGQFPAEAVLWTQAFIFVVIASGWHGSASWLSGAAAAACAVFAYREGRHREALSEMSRLRAVDAHEQTRAAELREATDRHKDRELAQLREQLEKLRADLEATRDQLRAAQPFIPGPGGCTQRNHLAVEATSDGYVACKACGSYWPAGFKPPMPGSRILV